MKQRSLNIYDDFTSSAASEEERHSLELIAVGAALSTQLHARMDLLLHSQRCVERAIFHFRGGKITEQRNNKADTTICMRRCPISVPSSCLRY